MHYIARELESTLARAARSFAAVVLTGPRRAGKTVTPTMARPMLRLAEAMRKKRPRSAAIRLSLVHQAPTTPVPTRAVAPGVQAWAWQDFLQQR